MSFYDEHFIPQLKFYVSVHHEELSGHYGNVRDFIKITDWGDHINLAWVNRDTEVVEHGVINMSVMELLKIL